MVSTEIPGEMACSRKLHFQHICALLTVMLLHKIQLSVITLGQNQHLKHFKNMQKRCLGSHFTLAVKRHIMHFSMYLSYG